MANFANTGAGRTIAEALVKTRMDAGTWVVGHWAIDINGNTIVRYQRFMSASAPDEGGWLTSRDDAAT